ncbi:MAG: putative pyridoxine 5'-phosphate oxidase superfamily flavin-nucleotide-binding protein [Myxococcota bacterium]
MSTEQVRCTVNGMSDAPINANLTETPALRSDIAFSPAVKAAQEARGSRAGYARSLERRDWPDLITAELADFIAQRDSFYLGTASADGQPYIQHRGGPVGFLKVLDERRLAFADYKGNRQYISLGNLSENPSAFIFLMDYANRRRIKVWGIATFVEAADDPALTAATADPTYPAAVERVLVFTVHAWDINCPQHITPRC